MLLLKNDRIAKDIFDDKVSFEHFMNNLDIKIISKNENTIEFDLINCHPSIANAIRRILTSETPTYAFHDLSIHENSTIFPDEYLAQRIGLIPISANHHGVEEFDQNFILKVQNDTDKIIDVTSDSIINESASINIKSGVLICRLAPKHKIHIEMTISVGIGRVHAKWSPVSLYTYKIMPRIVLKERIMDSDAIELQKLFSPGVIEIQNNEAVVINPRIESMSREVFRHDRFKDKVILSREDGWFCFTVETVAEDPTEIVKRAVNVLIEKIRLLKKDIELLYTE